MHFRRLALCRTARPTVTELVAALHGVKWINSDIAVELIHTKLRGLRGVLIRGDVLLDGETQAVAGFAVTTPEHTAFGIGQ